MNDRLTVQKDKRKTKRYKRHSWFIIFLSLGCIMGFGVLSGLLYAEYIQTETWEGSELDQELAHIPPEFAQNTYDLGMLDDIHVLGQTAEVLDTIDENNGITSDMIDNARQVAEVTQNLLETYAIESGNSVQNLDRLTLYIDIYDVEQTVYETLDTEELTRVMNDLGQRVLYDENETDEKVLTRLQSIVDQLNTLNAFIDTYHEPLGEMVDNTLIVPTSMTQETTDTILQTIEEQELNSFQVIQNLQRVLTSRAWESVLANNDTLRNIARWEEEWAVFNELNRSQYRRIGSYTTLEDVQDVDWIAVQGIEERPNQSIVGQSIIRSLMVNDQTLSVGQYVRRGLTVQANIDPLYQTNDLPEEGSIPEFAESPDYRSLADTLTGLLDERDQRLEAERAQAEREQEERERLEREQAEQEQAEREQAEREQAEQEQAEQHRLEQERLEREQEERERLEQEEQEQDEDEDDENEVDP